MSRNSLFFLIFSLWLVGSTQAVPETSFAYCGDRASHHFAAAAFLETIYAAAEETGHVVVCDGSGYPIPYCRLLGALEHFGSMASWEVLDWCWIFSSVTPELLSEQKDDFGNLALEGCYEELLACAGLYLRRKKERGIEDAIQGQKHFYTVLSRVCTTKLTKDLYRHRCYFWDKDPAVLRQELLGHVDDWYDIPEKGAGATELMDRIRAWRLEVASAQANNVAGEFEPPVLQAQEGLSRPAGQEPTGVADLDD